MLKHIQGHYGDSVLASRLSPTLDLSERQVEVATRETEPCLVCGEELSLSALRNHVAQHMGDVALFVLPNTDEDEDAGGSGASVEVAKLGSRAAGGDPDWDAGSIGLSAAGGSKQGPRNFANILEGDEVGYEAKIPSWEAEGDDQPSNPNTPSETVENFLDHPDEDVIQQRLPGPSSQQTASEAKGGSTPPPSETKPTLDSRSRERSGSLVDNGPPRLQCRSVSRRSPTQHGWPSHRTLIAIPRLIFWATYFPWTFCIMNGW